MTLRTGLAIALVAACREAPLPAEPPAPSPLESAIAAQLRERVGATAVACSDALACRATLADGSAWPVEVQVVAGGWEWRIAGLVVTDPIEAYLRETLADLDVAQGVQCAPRIQRLEPGGRIACALERGGAAFVTVAADGSTALELDLDPPAGAARSEEVSPERDLALLEMSRALAAEDDGD